MPDKWSAEDRVGRLRRRLWAERVIFLLALGGVLALHFGAFGTVGKRKVCLIAIDGKPAAVVASRADARSLLQEVKNASGLPGEVSFSQKVTLHSVPAAGSEVLEGAEAMRILMAQLRPVTQASVILSDGEPVVGLPSREEAVRALSLVLDHFSPPGEDVAAVFEESIKVETRAVPAELFVPSATEALERIRSAAAPKGSHEVKPGETGWKIALAYQVPLGRLAAANPEVDLNRLRAGDRLKIPGELPPLTVIARREITETGAGGREQKVRVVYVNGAEVERYVIRREPRARRPSPRAESFRAREEEAASR